MPRLLLMVMLISCSGPTTAVATAPPTTAATRSAVPATAPPTTTVRAAPTPEPSGLPACAASQLQAVAAGLVTLGEFAGAVFVANRGTAPCTLRGNPELALLARDGSPLDVRRASVSAGAPKLVVLPVSEFRQDPAGVAGVGASAPLEWSNYCDDVLPSSFRLTLPGAGGAVDGTFVDIAGKPVSVFPTAPCEDASGPSTLVVYPFQEPVR